MSWAFIQTMRDSPGQSYVQVLQRTRGLLGASTLKSHSTWDVFREYIFVPSLAMEPLSHMVSLALLDVLICTRSAASTTSRFLNTFNRVYAEQSSAMTSRKINCSHNVSIGVNVM